MINVCFIKIRSKLSSNTLLSLLRIFMKQTLLPTGTTTNSCSNTIPDPTPTPTPVTPTPTAPIPDYCDCAMMWIDETVDFLELSATVRPRKLTRKIFQKWDNDGCFDIADLQDMFRVS